jgi:hypothetical protein
VAYIDASSFVLTLPAAVGTITGSSLPLTIGEVATVCEQISAELDSAAAAAGYAVPISTTATAAYGQMQLLTVRGAGCHTLRVIFPGSEAGKMPLADTYCAAYAEALKMLRAGDYILIGAPPGPEGQGRELPRSYSTSNPLATSGVDPQATMDWVP